MSMVEEVPGHLKETAIANKKTSFLSEKYAFLSIIYYLW